MSTSAKKSPSSNISGLRPSTEPMATPNQTKSASSRTPGTPSQLNGSIARSRSIRTPLSARAAMQRSSTSVNSSTDNTASDIEDEAHTKTVIALEELKESLRNAEAQASHSRKEAETLKLRLDESLAEQGKLEDRLHESEERLETTENEKRDALRQQREMEVIYEAERSAMNRGQDEAANREEEMHSIIQRLKEALSQKTVMDEESRLSRRCEL